jgi:hypothetical protein
MENKGKAEGGTTFRVHVRDRRASASTQTQSRSLDEVLTSHDDPPELPCTATNDIQSRYPQPLQLRWQDPIFPSIYRAAATICRAVMAFASIHLGIGPGSMPHNLVVTPPHALETYSSTGYYIFLEERPMQCLRGKRIAALNLNIKHH